MHKPETILKQIANQHGITILAQSRLKGLILDMMPTAERKHINVMRRAIDEQIGARLLEMQYNDPAVRQIKINTLKEKFKNDNAFDDTAFYIVDCFVNAIDWKTPKPEVILHFKEIKIGDQIWADQNLNVTYFRNGDSINKAMTDEEWISAGEKKQPAWCNYNNDPKNGKKYGKLYNWYAIDDPRGLAPEGWHVPSEQEWAELILFLRRVKDARQKPVSNLGRKENGKGSDDIGFKALSGGGRSSNGNYSGIGIYGRWWSSAENSSSYAWNRDLSSDYADIRHYYNIKNNGFSVRFIRDID